MKNSNPEAVRPCRFLREGAAAPIIARYSDSTLRFENEYATVRDYCDSVDHLPQIAGTDGDLKNVQRPWAIKNLLHCVPPPARVLEIGGGEPVVSGFLAELGYDVTLIDPYDGTGNGPTDIEIYRARFPEVKIVRGYFSDRTTDFVAESFAAIFSVSVLEHIPPEPLRECLKAIPKFLIPGGVSMHCFDFVLSGTGQEYARHTAEIILAEQAAISGASEPTSLDHLIRTMEADLETFFLSPQGHHHWRGGLPYDQFPFRRVASIQTTARRT